LFGKTQRLQTLPKQDWIKYSMVIKEECFWSIKDHRQIVLVERKNFPGSLSFVKAYNPKLELLSLLQREVGAQYDSPILKQIYSFLFKK